MHAIPDPGQLVSIPVHLLGPISAARLRKKSIVVSAALLAFVVRGSRVAIATTPPDTPISFLRNNAFVAQICVLSGRNEIPRITSRDKQASRQWNATINAYYYIGFTPPVGKQLRYHLHCQHGPLALIGFASAAWKVAPRDVWIGWNHQQRIAGLSHIINNTRFLILPWIYIPNLASRILAATARLASLHWRQDYGIQPHLLETFVDTNRYTGHCYKAANWIHLGTTQGRGRYDRYTQRMAPPKDVWVDPLCRHPKTALPSLVGG